MTDEQLLARVRSNLAGHYERGEPQNLDLWWECVERKLQDAYLALRDETRAAERQRQRQMRAPGDRSVSQ